jgi:hypothetical protein
MTTPAHIPARRIRVIPLLVTVALAIGIPFAAATLATLFLLPPPGRHADMLTWLYVQHGIQLLLALLAIVIVRHFVPADYGLH